MTTPPPQQFPVTVVTTLCWSGASNAPAITFENTDQIATMWLGQSAAMAAGDGNSIPLPPLASITLPGTVTWYVVSNANPPGPLLIVPGASSISDSPQAIAQAMINVGVAEAIAQAILGTGLPLVPNPTMLYNVSGTQPQAGLANIGFTIPNQALTAGCYANRYGSQAAADTAMVGILGRPQGSAHPTFTKKFWNDTSIFNLPFNDMQNYGAFGTKVACALKPSVVRGLPANTNFRTSPLCTPAQQAQANADYSGLQTFFNTLLGAPYNFTTALLTGVLYQEPEVGKNNITPTDFQNIIFTYGGALNAVGIPLILDIGSGGGVSTGQAFCNAGIAGAAAAGVTLGGLAQDLYMPTWLRGNVTLDMIGSIAKAHNLPFGVYEFGCAPGNFGANGMADATNFLLGQHAAGGNYGILDYLSTFVQNTLPMLDSEYYMGQCAANGAGDLTSPIGLDPTVATPDFRIPLYHQIFDTLTAVPTTAFTIPANTTKTMPPINPSPIGMLAPADFLSFELLLAASAGVGSTNPFLQLILSWFDFDQVARDQTAIDQETWFIPMGANADPNGPLIVAGGGRMRGGFMTIKITNQDTVACTINTLEIAGTSRTGKRTQLLWDPNANNSPAVPGFTLAQAAHNSLQLGREELQNVNAGQTAKWLNGLWSGRIFVRVLVSGVAAANTVHFQLQPQPTGVFGTQNLVNLSMGIVGGNDERELFIDSPRCTLMARVDNNDANPVTVSYQLIGEETS